MNHEMFFNELAPNWDNMTKVDLPKLNHIVAQIELKDGQSVLDIGTGTGVLIPLLREKIGIGGRLVAVDVSTEMLAIARRKFGNVADFFQADVISLPWAAQCFDQIICYSAFPHFPDKIAALREMVRVLKPHGHITIAHASGRSKLNAFHRSLNNFVSSDLLPDDEELINIGEKLRLVTRFLENNEEYYIIKLKRIREKRGNA